MNSLFGWEKRSIRGICAPECCACFLGFEKSELLESHDLMVGIHQMRGHNKVNYCSNQMDIYV